MVSTGMARKVDDLGRIVLPVEMRRMFGIQPGDELAISVDGASILLRKIEARCVFCAEAAAGLRLYREKQVCSTCAKELGAADADAQGDLVNPTLADV